MSISQSQDRERDEEGNAFSRAAGYLEECHFRLAVLRPRESPPGPRKAQRVGTVATGDGIAEGVVQGSSVPLSLEKFLQL